MCGDAPLCPIGMEYGPPGYGPPHWHPSGTGEDAEQALRWEERPRIDYRWQCLVTDHSCPGYASVWAEFGLHMRRYIEQWHRRRIERSQWVHQDWRRAGVRAASTLAAVSTSVGWMEPGAGRSTRGGANWRAVRRVLVSAGHLTWPSLNA